MDRRAAPATSGAALDGLRSELRVLKAKWRDQVFDDVGASEFKLAYALADFMTMNDSVEKFAVKGRIVVWPSQTELGRRSRLSADTIRRCINKLIDRGHLRRLKHGNQFTGSSRYRIVIDEEE
jgi:hypothetical protein